jgi:8-oxo-dGTP diphosphatase
VKFERFGICARFPHMSTEPTATQSKIDRYGAVAVIVRQGRLLVIKRSQQVIAPGLYCFPGGGIESGETEPQAVIRELQEELGCTVRPLRRLWECVSSWRVHLAWWSAQLDDHAPILPNPLEVESFHWLTLGELAELPNQLESNQSFLGAIARGEISLD